jgi:hypothetical protein
MKLTLAYLQLYALQPLLRLQRVLTAASAGLFHSTTGDGDTSGDPFGFLFPLFPNVRL